MAKKTTSNVKKIPKSKSASSLAPSKSFSDNIAEQFEGATSSVRGAVSGVPASAFYWSIGALALGAAAVGAYMYRGRIIKLYDEAVEAFSSDGETADTDSTELQSGRKSNSSAELDQVEAH